MCDGPIPRPLPASTCPRPAAWELGIGGILAGQIESCQCCSDCTALTLLFNGKAGEIRSSSFRVWYFTDLSTGACIDLRKGLVGESRGGTHDVARRGELQEPVPAARTAAG